MQQGKCLIFSAPSGAGKTTIVHHLLEQNFPLAFSISACTRDRRPNEVEGEDYYFLSPEAFKTKIKEEAFIEWEEVYQDQFYGTLKSEIERIWAAGKQVIFDVDVVGGLNLKKYFGEAALAVFIMPPSLQALEDRLRGRGTETEEKLQKRLNKSKQELIVADQFDTVILNDDLEKARKEATDLVHQFLQEA